MKSFNIKPLIYDILKEDDAINMDGGISFYKEYSSIREEKRKAHKLLHRKKRDVIIYYYKKYIEEDYRKTRIELQYNFLFDNKKERQRIYNNSINNIRNNIRYFVKIYNSWDFSHGIYDEDMFDLEPEEASTNHMAEAYNLIFYVLEENKEIRKIRNNYIVKILKYIKRNIV